MRSCMFVILAIAMSALTGCATAPPSNNQPTPAQAIMTAVQGVTCAVQNDADSFVGGLVVSQCAGTGTPQACGSAIQQSLTNINLCNTPIPASMKIGAPAHWNTVGDITAAELQEARLRMKAGQKLGGAIGALVCPIIFSNVLGFLTPVVPPACGCTQNFAAGSLAQLLQSGCVAAFPM